jgi:YggT family protein
MFVLANFISATAGLLDGVLYCLELIIIVRVILSWANADPSNALVKTLQTISEPVLKPFRKLMPPWKMNGLDLSPVLAILAIEFMKRFLISTLFDIAQKLK